MPSFFRSIIILFSILVLTISCGESNNQQEEENNLLYFIGYEPNENLTLQAETKEGFNLSIVNTRAFSGDHSLKITNNNSCYAMTIFDDLSILNNQTYEISFLIQRSGTISDVSECDTTGPLSLEKNGLENDQRKNKAGVSIAVDDIILYQSVTTTSFYNDKSSEFWLDVCQDNQSIVKTSGIIIESDTWATITVLISIVNEGPISVSLKTNYETLWIDDVEIRQVSNTEQ